MASKRTELELAEKECSALQERSREAEEAVKKSRAHFQAVTAGLSSGSDGQDDTLAAQKIGGCGPRRFWVDRSYFWSSGLAIGIRLFVCLQRVRMRLVLL